MASSGNQNPAAFRNMLSDFFNLSWNNIKFIYNSTGKYYTTSYSKVPKIYHFRNMSEISPLCEGSIGCISASVPVATFQPLDTLKIRLQTERHLYKNLHDCWTKIVKKEGIISAYKGMWAAVLSQAPINFFIFAGNSVGEKLIQNFDISDGKKAYFSGSVGGLFGTLATCPTELLKCRLQVNKTRLTM